MTNIWEFLLQTVEVSLTAALLLLLKWMLQDKLSPRWQYGVWTLLAAKLLIPTGLAGKYMSESLAVWLETRKAMTESTMDSAFTDAYLPIGFKMGSIPFIKTAPVSLSDWIFALYLAGVLICIARYVYSYIRLRVYLSRREVGDDLALAETVETVCSAYGLRSCKAVRAGGISSAFVCGVFRPVLVVPMEEEYPDEKILLHELMHRRYFDSLQNIFWSLMRALHWCNPFLQYVFNRIGNDMESLCDQRVLERLEGEARRDYGRILLDMTNEKYARAPGTTSLSNGGRNISRRIKAIARFKKYPKGMALASVCIVLMLAPPIFAGTVGEAYDGTNSEYFVDQDAYAIQHAMAAARIRRCTTPAGAIDTWVKGTSYDRPVYMAAVTPIKDQEALIKQMHNGKRFSDAVDDVMGKTGIEDYVVFNMKKLGPNSYSALVVIEGKYSHEDYDNAVLAAPIQVYREDGWVVKTTGAPYWKKITTSMDLRGNDKLPFQAVSQGKGETGIVSISEQTVFYIDSREYAQNDEMMFFDEEGAFDPYADPDAEFASVDTWRKVEYNNLQGKSAQKKISSAGMIMCPLESLGKEPEWQFDIRDIKEGNCGSSSSDQSYISGTYEGDWNGHLEDSSGTGHSELKKLKKYAGYAVQIYRNNKLIETIKMKRGAKI